VKDIAKKYADRRAGVELAMPRAPVIVPAW